MPNPPIILHANGAPAAIEACEAAAQLHLTNRTALLALVRALARQAAREAMAGAKRAGGFPHQDGDHRDDPC